MTRRLVLVATALVGAYLPSAAAQEPVEPPPRPNILIVVTDDQRIGTMGVMAETRRLFGTEGTRFANAFATTPLCCPSRASIMSGRYAHNHGIETQQEGEAFALEQSMTMQRELRDAGYRTGIFGKFLNGWDLDASPTYFDEWAIFSHASPNGYYGGTWNDQGSLRTVNRYSTNFIRDRAIRFVSDSETSDEQPWYLNLAVAAPHAPFDPAPRYSDARIRLWPGTPAVAEDDRSDKPSWVLERNEKLTAGRWLRNQQLRTLMSVDDMIERVFSKLAALGEEDTLAFFISDNGFLWGEHGLTQKRFPYLPSVKVPLYARWPGRIAAGAVDERLTANIDIAPTAYAAAGVTPAYEPDGRSLLDASSRSRLLLEFWSYPGTQPPTWASTVTSKYQFVEYYSDQGLPIASEYYDLQSDPWQLLNLLGDADDGNDPATASLSLQLSFDRSCEADNCP